MPLDQSPTVAAQGKQKKQMTIVVLLLVGLLVAIITQPSAEESDEINVTPSAVPKLADRNPQLTDADAPRTEFTTTQQLSRLDLDQMLQANLFLMPEPVPQPELAAIEQVEPVEEVTVQAIYGSGRLTSIGSGLTSGEHRALIGQSIIRPGEVLPDGRQVVKVSPDGLEIAD